NSGAGSPSASTRASSDRREASAYRPVSCRHWFRPNRCCTLPHMSPPAVAWPWPWQLRAWCRLLNPTDEPDKTAKAVSREAWGYVFWIPVVVLLFLPAELIPAFWPAANWPTFSTTVGHLEYLFGPT